MQSLSISTQSNDYDPYLEDEEDAGVNFVSRIEAIYTCEDGHTTTVTLSTDAEIPVEWDCVICSKPAKLKNSEGHEAVKKTKNHKKPTPWDRLQTRRTNKELEKMFQTRLKSLKSGEVPMIFTV